MSSQGLHVVFFFRYLKRWPSKLILSNALLAFSSHVHKMVLLYLFKIQLMLYCREITFKFLHSTVGFCKCWLSIVNCKYSPITKLHSHFLSLSLKIHVHSHSAFQKGKHLRHLKMFKMCGSRKSTLILIPIKHKTITKLQELAGVLRMQDVVCVYFFSHNFQHNPSRMNHNNSYSPRTSINPASLAWDHAKYKRAWHAFQLQVYDQKCQH